MTSYASADPMLSSRPGPSEDPIFTEPTGFRPNEPIRAMGIVTSINPGYVIGLPVRLIRIVSLAMVIVRRFHR